MSSAASGRAPAAGGGGHARRRRPGSARSASTSATRRAPSSSASGTSDGGAGVDEVAGVAGLLVGGDERRRHEDRRQARRPASSKQVLDARPAHRPRRRRPARPACRPRTRTAPVARGAPGGAGGLRPRSPSQSRRPDDVVDGEVGPVAPQRGGAASAASLIRSAPSEPPKTSTSRRSGSTPKARLAAARSRSGSRAQISARIGLPVTTARGQRRCPGSGTADALANRASEPVGRARAPRFCSATTIGTRRTTAASAHGHAGVAAHRRPRPGGRSRPTSRQRPPERHAAGRRSTRDVRRASSLRWMPRPGSSVSRIAGRRAPGGPRCPARADVVDRARRCARRDERVGDGEGGQHVARRCPRR